MADYYPYPGFRFSVAMVGHGREHRRQATNIDGSFQEVSGLKAEMEMDIVQEGGENRHKIYLPKGIKYSNLVLKRGLVGAATALGKWVSAVFSDDLLSATSDTDIQLPDHLLVMLLSEKSEPLMVWNVVNAIPVRWEVSGFDAMKNGYLIEEIEFAYHRFERSTNT